MTIEELKEEIEKSFTEIFEEESTSEQRIELIDRVNNLLTIYNVIRSIETDGIERVDPPKNQKYKNNNWLKMDGLE